MQDILILVALFPITFSPLSDPSQFSFIALPFDVSLSPFSYLVWLTYFTFTFLNFHLVLVT